jgi:hypothetical protein
LFKEFLAFEDVEQLILSGILYSDQDSIKEDFQKYLLRFARCHYTAENEESALGYLLRIQSNYFE